MQFHQKNANVDLYQRLNLMNKVTRLSVAK